MKKVISVIVSLLIAGAAFSGCQAKPATPTATSAPSVTTPSKAEAVEIRIGGLKGPTSMGMVELMESDEKGTSENNYTFTIAGSADELTPKLVQGELDIAAVPANLASVLYNNTKKSVSLLAVNTLGVVYIVETGNEIQTLSDLKGKTIYATGKGSTPEYNLRYLLKENGLDPDKDITIEWKTEPTEVVALLSGEKGGIAMMPQPYVTVAQGSVNNLRIAVDLTESWDKLKNGSTLITGVLIVRNEFAEKHPEELAAFLAEYKKSTEYVNANLKEASLLVEKYGIVKAAVAEKAIPYCHITYMDGAGMKSAMEGYLAVLFEQNPKSVGGALPGADFYYEK
ncbi:ABC transporter substrate-binding protein [Youngiibacter multivorans]|uniref:NitT/TauT family transport system substrate-binding protein n=1 Tax=Youngiibacter multivorans TaxID=937251 RepID=A0ABS4G074_9CLOT|nr:ABC transporter substrate-binding protein [Youngiibacter multivorans]MBP1917948.1 NitT/TauT family transport system substrate-binding protein [Youngiibacter multivorans]